MDDHAESMLSFEFGMKSLLQLSIECCEENMSNQLWQMIQELPKNLRDTFDSRKCFSTFTMYETARPLVEKPKLFAESIIHAGL